MKEISNFKFQISNNERGQAHSAASGQALLEVLVALAIGIIIATAFVTLGTLSVRNSRSASDQVTATKLAQEGIEAMLTIRDQNRDNSITGYVGVIKWTQLVDQPLGTCSLDDPTISCPGANNDYNLCKDPMTGDWCINRGGVEPPIKPAATDVTTFSRKVRITGDAPGIKDVTVFVWWTDPTGLHKSILTRKLGRDKLE